MPIFSAIILKQGDEVCLLKRSKSSINGGVYAFAGGSVDGNETIIDATIRETEEELGILLTQDSLRLAHVLHVKTPNNQEYVNFFFIADAWNGTPTIMEPHKFDDLRFAPLKQLPEDTMKSHKHVVYMMEKGVMYSEYGW